MTQEDCPNCKVRDTDAGRLFTTCTEHWNVFVNRIEAPPKVIPEVQKLMSEPSVLEKRKKAVYIGAPAVFALEMCCQHINEAFGKFHCYLVGSSIERPDWRDVDVRFIMDDEEFAKLFPKAGSNWESDPRWLILTVAISQWMSQQTGLPIDFQIQPQTHANEVHKGKRYALGLSTEHRR